jgi:chemotaxis protein CheC
MDDNVQLSELQHDAIVELLNIGMGNAARSLNEIVNKEVKLSIPSLELLTRQEVANRLNTQPKAKITTVKQHFNGPFWGETFLLFPQEKSSELVKVFIKDDVPQNMLAELEIDALTEVGNIILNACISSLANNLTHELTSELPVFMTGTATEVLGINATGKDEVVMFLRMDFALQSTDIEGYVAFILEVPSIKQFKISVDKYLGKIGN